MFSGPYAAVEVATVGGRHLWQRRSALLDDDLSERVLLDVIMKLCDWLGQFLGMEG